MQVIVISLQAETYDQWWQEAQNFGMAGAEVWSEPTPGSAIPKNLVKSKFFDFAIFPFFHKSKWSVIKKNFFTNII